MLKITDFSELLGLHTTKLSFKKFSIFIDRHVEEAGNREHSSALVAVLLIQTQTYIVNAESLRLCLIT